jgi:hypothetical protein
MHCHVLLSWNSMVLVTHYSTTVGRLSRFACGQDECQPSLRMHRKTLKQHIFSSRAANPLSPIASVQVGPEFSEIKRAEHFPANWKRLPQENAPR